MTNGSRGSSIAISAKSYITTCKHMLCQNCKEKFKSVCARCGKQCSFMQINENMQPSLRDFIEPVVQQITKFQKKIGDVRNFQREQNRLRRYNLKGFKRKYEQAAIQEKAITKEVMHLLNEGRNLNAKIKCIGRMETSQRRRRYFPLFPNEISSFFCWLRKHINYRLITKPNVQHQPAPNVFMQEHHNGNDRTPSYRSGSFGFREKGFTQQHYTHAPYPPSVSSLNSAIVNNMHSGRPRHRHQFIHSTPLSWNNQTNLPVWPAAMTRTEKKRTYFIFASDVYLIEHSHEARHITITITWDLYINICEWFGENLAAFCYEFMK